MCVSRVIRVAWRTGEEDRVCVRGRHGHKEQPDNEHIDPVQRGGKGQTSVY